MIYRDDYIKKVKLLLQVIPFLNKTPDFALKGGTALNFYLHDMPRLSVDIDLTYLPIQPRELSIESINRGLILLSDWISHSFPGMRTRLISQSLNYPANKLSVHYEQAEIKIEPNYTLRGSVFPPATKTKLCQQAENLFRMSHEITTLAPADLYAGKWCAALTRQHPRDLFDVVDILKTKKLSQDYLDAFVVYLSSSNKPFDEVLNPQPKPHAMQIKLYEQQLVGMLKTPIMFDEIKDTPKKLAILIKEQFTENHRQFLLSLADGVPEWQRLPSEELQYLPGLQWKLRNIQSMDSKKRKEAFEKLFNTLR